MAQSQPGPDELNGLGIGIAPRIDERSIPGREARRIEQRERQRNRSLGVRALLSSLRKIGSFGRFESGHPSPHVRSRHSHGFILLGQTLRPVLDQRQRFVRSTSPSLHDVRPALCVKVGASDADEDEANRLLEQGARDTRQGTHALRHSDRAPDGRSEGVVGPFNPGLV